MGATQKSEAGMRCDAWAATLPGGDYVCQKPQPETDVVEFEEPRDLTEAQFGAHMRAMARLPRLRPGDDDGRVDRERVIENSICKLAPKTTSPKQTWLGYCEKEVARRNAGGGITRVGVVDIDGMAWCAVVATGIVFRS